MSKTQCYVAAEFLSLHHSLLHHVFLIFLLNEEADGISEKLIFRSRVISSTKIYEVMSKAINYKAQKFKRFIILHKLDNIRCCVTHSVIPSSKPDGLCYKYLISLHHELAMWNRHTKETMTFRKAANSSQKVSSVFISRVP